MHVRLLLPIAFLALSGCAELGIDAVPKTADEVIKENEAKGPEVEGVDATTAKNAQDAMNRGEYEKAAQGYRQLMSRHPDAAEYKIGLGNATRRAGRYAEAISTYDTVLKDDPANVRAKEGKALALMANGDTVNAGKLLQEVIAADPTRWRALNAAGILFAMKNLPSESVQYFQAALAAKPNNPSVLNNLGLTYALDRDYLRASETLEKAVASTPEGSPEKKRVALNLAMVYGISNRMEDAERVAKPYLTPAGLYNNLGLYALLAKDKRTAKDYLNMALTKSPVYYDKAWKNLEAVNQSGGGKSK